VLEEINVAYKHTDTKEKRVHLLAFHLDCPQVKRGITNLKSGFPVTLSVIISFPIPYFVLQVSVFSHRGGPGSNPGGHVGIL
jgi:hypothetical protein